MPRNQTVFISRKKLKKPQKTLAENSDVSVFQKKLLQLRLIRHRSRPECLPNPDIDIVVDESSLTFALLIKKY
jgi:hypothetical protein